MSQETWKQIGYAMHFIGADNCRFHLATLLPSGYVVSTVGDYYPPAVHVKILLTEMEPSQIGYNRTFETMVFKTSGKFASDGRPVIKDWIPKASDGYNDPISASNGHLKMCKLYEKFDKDSKSQLKRKAIQRGDKE